MTRSLKEQSESVKAALTAHISYRCYANESDDLKGPVDTSDLDSSGESEPASHYDDYKDSVRDTSDNLNGSADSEPQSIRDTRQNDKSQGYKRNSYIVPKEPKIAQTEAAERISKALDQVEPSVHLNPQYTSTRKARERLQHFMWVTWISTQANKI